jgi:hypothetical protein
MFLSSAVRKWDMWRGEFTIWVNRQRGKKQQAQNGSLAVAGPEDAGRRVRNTKSKSDRRRGLRRDLVLERFPSASRLREYLETFDWRGAHERDAAGLRRK